MRDCSILHCLVPASVRERRDYAAAKRVGDLLLYRHRHADVFIVSYPKSGRSWLRVMLTHYFCAVYERPFAPTLDIVDLTNTTPNAPRIAFVHDGSSHENTPHFSATEMPDDRTFYRNRRVVLLVRDLRDVMVSYFMHATKRQQVYTGSISEFIRDKCFGIGKPVRFLNIWHANRHLPRNLMLLRYEDLKFNGVGELLRLVQFLGFPLNFQAACEAVAFTQFEKMRAMERSGQLQAENRFGIGTSHDEDGYKVRKGCVGGFLNDLSPSDARMLSDYINSELSPWYGYCGLFHDEIERRYAA